MLSNVDETIVEGWECIECVDSRIVGLAIAIEELANEHKAVDNTNR